jgi:hypothetical protein
VDPAAAQGGLSEEGKPLHESAVGSAQFLVISDMLVVTHSCSP